MELMSKNPRDSRIYFEYFSYELLDFIDTCYPSYLNFVAKEIISRLKSQPEKVNEDCNLIVDVMIHWLVTFFQGKEEIDSAMRAFEQWSRRFAFSAHAREIAQIILKKFSTDKHLKPYYNAN